MASSGGPIKQFVHRTRGPSSREFIGMLYDRVVHAYKLLTALADIRTGFIRRMSYSGAEPTGVKMRVASCTISRRKISVGIQDEPQSCAARPKWLGAG
jgi:hypothetical protein